MVFVPAKLIYIAEQLIFFFFFFFFTASQKRYWGRPVMVLPYTRLHRDEEKKRMDMGNISQLKTKTYKDLKVQNLPPGISLYNFKQKFVFLGHCTWFKTCMFCWFVATRNWYTLQLIPSTFSMQTLIIMVQKLNFYKIMHSWLCIKSTIGTQCCVTAHSLCFECEDKLVDGLDMQPS